MNPKHLLNKTMLVFAIVFGIMATAELNAQSFTYGDLNYTVNADGATVTCTGAVENDVIEKVVIPNSVIEMERWVFDGCTELDTVVIGSGMVNMHDRCLDGTQLSNVTILAENPPAMEDLVNDYIIGSLVVPCGSLS